MIVKKINKLKGYQFPMGKYDTYVEQCTAHFKALLEEQLEREDRMEADDEKKDFANLDHIVIGFRGGDGIVTRGVEGTIRNIGILAREGMRETDKVILQIMLNCEDE